MKHLHQKQLNWEKSRQVKRFESYLKRKDLKYDTTKRINSKQTVLGHRIIEAPTKLILYNSDEKRTHLVKLTLEFFDTLRESVGTQKLLLDFSNTIRIDAAALLVMFAITEENLGKSDKKIRYSLPKDSKPVKRQLRKSYFIKLLERSDRSSLFEDKQMHPVVTGVGNDKLDSLIDYLLDKVFEKKATPSQEHVYSDAISETVHNVGLHAYPDRNREDKKWWLLSQVIDNQLFLAIYDTGVGIPKTVVKQSYFFGKLKDGMPNLFKKISDSLLSDGYTHEDIKSFSSHFYSMGFLSDEQAIYLSLRPDMSGTQKDKHGQGSKSIKKLVEDSVNGTLWVFSNKGAYSKEQKNEPTIQALPGDVKGTLVQWNIELI